VLDFLIAAGRESIYSDLGLLAVARRAKPIDGKRHCCMADPIDMHSIKDRGGRRVLPDRRKSSSFDHFPERRFQRYRRSGLDRRSLQNLKMRKKMERRKAFKEKYTE
jgi:hypothetical protein